VYNTSDWEEVEVEVKPNETARAAAQMGHMTVLLCGCAMAMILKDMLQQFQY
jgi:hypothetical protein